VIEGGKIMAVTKGADVAADKGTAVLDLHGHTVMRAWWECTITFFISCGRISTAGGTLTIPCW
jgi:hypothetical protein